MFNRKKQIEILIKSLQKYKKESQIEKYSEECFINDIIYFLGTSFGEEFEFYGGYQKFLKKLREAINHPYKERIKP